MTAALEGGEWSAARPGRTLAPGKRWYPFYRRLGGPQGRSERSENLVPTGIRSRTVQVKNVNRNEIRERYTKCSKIQKFEPPTPKNNKKKIVTSSVYDCTVEDVEYICNSNSTLVD